jgi:hypothetical protein
LPAKILSSHKQVRQETHKEFLLKKEFLMFLKRIPQIPQGIKKEIFDGFLEKGRKWMVAKIAKRNFRKLKESILLKCFRF